MSKAASLENSSLPRRYLAYFAQRFPLPGAGVYALALVAAPYAFAGTIPGAPQPSAPRALALFLLAFLVLLHLRIFDEHKDFQKDRIAYPDRLLSRGVITLADLRWLLLGALLLETCLAIYLGWAPFLLWLAVLAWSTLMYVEFFVGSFLNRHLLLYLLTHQLLVPLLALVGVAARSWDSLFSGAVNLLLLLLGVMGATVSYELARKTWSPDRENDHADSYTSAWGRGPAVAAGLLAGLVCGAALGLLAFRLGQGWPLLACYALLLLLLSAAEILFLARPRRGISKLLEAVGALFMLGMLLASTIAFLQL